MTEDPNDFNATVSGMGSKNLDDIVDDIMKDGTENNRNTIKLSLMLPETEKKLKRVIIRTIRTKVVMSFLPLSMKYLLMRLNMFFVFMVLSF